jgi:ubiquinone biosynthesis protein UbiJ
VAVRVNADPGWRAFQDGRAIPIEIDNLGFMVLRPAAAAAMHVVLEYRGTAEPRLMAALSALAWLAALAALFLCRKPLASPTTK